jgi:hypothetical protein
MPPAMIVVVSGAVAKRPVCGPSEDKAVVFQTIYAAPASIVKLPVACRRIK